MNFEEFKERLSEDLKQALFEQTGENHTIETTTVNKLQNESYEAFTIRPEGSPIGVNLDVQSLYDAYSNGRSYDEVSSKAYEIVHRITKGDCYGRALKGDLLSELMWKKIVTEGFKNEWGLDDAIVVADGSGSMYSYASGSSSVMAIEICNALAIYFAEQLKGVFHNKAITFSERPKFIDLRDNTSLKDKLEIMFSHCEVANTNIEAVFDLILDMAKCKKVDETLFAEITKKYEAAGYRMPRLIFWNVCGRTDTIPMVNNEEGLCLLSGFSQNAMKVASDKTKKDPYEALIATLDSPRYQPVEDAIRDLLFLLR